MEPGSNGSSDERTDTPGENVDNGSDPNSEGARKSGKPVALWLAVCLAVIAVGAALSSAVHTYRAEQRRREPVSASEAQPRVVGSEDAGLKIEACLGPCIVSVFDGFAECAEAWPDKIRAELILYQSPEGQKFCAEHGEDLACIFFNEKNRFTLGEGDATREVHLYGPPGGEYQMHDLAEVLRLQMEEVYGELPDDFDEKTTAFETGPMSPESESAE